MSTPPTVLFICQHNAGRSQLGAHLLEHIAPGRANPTSGGIGPAEHINPVIAEALGELGIDTSAAVPRPVTAADLAAADIVVTMKPGLALPGPVTGRLVEWEFPDPNSWGIDGVRDLRDRVLEKVRALALEA
ncbi:Arsenate-mycothiol transferase ArsC2 [Microbacterium lemovicicum]|uniref:Arsenate-mycothiol transferase ArsC2 n=1 Tax=Microbacterium lemovicicum TaxID=1072463 RepID=A0A3S9W6U7_9MICO|nr:low molecular weight phosphatase family protein [Microbacterium lemovicicum]AZS35729.1 Arsenate-mycothiol transferase ArsC2 [Microbacterium lemovicicum]